MMIRSTWRYDPPTPRWISTTVFVLAATVFGVVWVVVSLGLLAALILRFL